MELKRNIVYLPLYNENEKRIYYRVSFKKFAITTVSLPLVAFTICVILSVYKDFDKATSTHCQVLNVLPSVSAAIGNFYPQNFLWQLAIGLHALPRYYTITMYFTYYRNVLRSSVHVLAMMACMLNVIEVTSLIGLSFWDSSNYYPVHKTCFITFVCTSEIYMVLSCFLLQRHKRTALTEVEKFSLRRKWYYFFINVLCILAACYFFVRHNDHCEPMIYTWFAAAEYMVILTNMGFHMTACYDFSGKEIIISYNGIRVK